MLLYISTFIYFQMYFQMYLFIYLISHLYIFNIIHLLNYFNIYL